MALRESLAPIIHETAATITYVGALSSITGLPRLLGRKIEDHPGYSYSKNASDYAGLSSCSACPYRIFTTADGQIPKKKNRKTPGSFGFRLQVVKCSISILKLLAAKLIFTVVFKNHQFVKPRKVDPVGAVRVDSHA